MSREESNLHNYNGNSNGNEKIEEYEDSVDGSVNSTPVHREFDDRIDRSQPASPDSVSNLEFQYNHRPRTPESPRDSPESPPPQNLSNYPRPLPGDYGQPESPDQSPYVPPEQYYSRSSPEPIFLDKGLPVGQRNEQKFSVDESPASPELDEQNSHHQQVKHHSRTPELESPASPEALSVHEANQEFEKSPQPNENANNTGQEVEEMEQEGHNSELEPEEDKLESVEDVKKDEFGMIDVEEGEISDVDEHEEKSKHKKKDKDRKKHKKHRKSSRSPSRSRRRSRSRERSPKRHPTVKEVFATTVSSNRRYQSTSDKQRRNDAPKNPYNHPTTLLNRCLQVIQLGENQAAQISDEDLRAFIKETMVLSRSIDKIHTKRDKLKLEMSNMTNNELGTIRNLHKALPRHMQNVLHFEGSTVHISNDRHYGAISLPPPPIINNGAGFFAQPPPMMMPPIMGRGGMPGMPPMMPPMPGMPQMSGIPPPQMMFQQPPQTRMAQPPTSGPPPPFPMMMNMMGPPPPIPAGVGMAPAPFQLPPAQTRFAPPAVKTEEKPKPVVSKSLNPVAFTNPPPGMTMSVPSQDFSKPPPFEPPRKKEPGPSYLTIRPTQPPQTESPNHQDISKNLTNMLTSALKAHVTQKPISPFNFSSPQHQQQQQQQPQQQQQQQSQQPQQQKSVVPSLMSVPTRDPYTKTQTAGGRQMPGTSRQGFGTRKRGNDEEE